MSLLDFPPSDLGMATHIVLHVKSNTPYLAIVEWAVGQKGKMLNYRQMTIFTLERLGIQKGDEVKWVLRTYSNFSVPMPDDFQWETAGIALESPNQVTGDSWSIRVQ